MPAKWDDETEKTMLLALLHLNPPANPSYAKIAGMIGSDFTAESVRQRFLKYRKANTAKWGEVEETERRKKKGGKRAGGKKPAAAAAAAEEMDAGEGDGKSDAAETEDAKVPVKKGVKKAAGKKAAAAEETDAGEGDGKEETEGVKSPVKKGGKKAGGGTKAGGKRKAKKDVDEEGEKATAGEETPAKKAKVDKDGQNDDEA